MRKITYSEWLAEGRSLFGVEFNEWIFKCPSCGHSQSINSILKHNPDLKRNDVSKVVNCDCEGRLTKEYGCKYSLYGLVQLHELEVEREGEIFMSFEFDTSHAKVSVQSFDVLPKKEEEVIE